MAHTSEQKSGAPADHAKALQQAATAILQEFSETLDTTTTSQVELGWLGALFPGGNGLQWGATAAAPLLRCRTCRRLLIAARAGLHLQHCGSSARPVGQKQQAQQKAGQAKRQHVSGGPHVKAPGNGAAKRTSDASGKSSKLPVPVAAVDVVKPTKLSKTTYPELGHRPLPVQPVHKPQPVDTCHVPRRKRSVLSRRRRLSIIDVSWLFEELPPLNPPPSFSMPPPPPGKRLKLSLGGSQPKIPKVKMFDGLASGQGVPRAPRALSGGGRPVASIPLPPQLTAASHTAIKPPSSGARSSSGHLLRGAALKSHLAKQAAQRAAQAAGPANGGSGGGAQPDPLGRTASQPKPPNTQYQDQLIYQQGSGGAGTAQAGSSHVQRGSGQQMGGMPGPAAGQQGLALNQQAAGMRQAAPTPKPNAMASMPPMGMPGAGMGMVGGMLPPLAQQQMMAGMLQQQHHMLRAAQMQAVVAQQQQQAAAARTHNMSAAKSGNSSASMMIPVPGAAMPAATPNMPAFNPMLPHGMNAMMQTQLPMMPGQMAMMRGMQGMGGVGQEGTGQLPMASPGLMNPATYPGTYLGMQWPGRQAHDALLGKPAAAAQPATQQRTVR